MTGYGLTVFQGTTVERFNFTVVAVLAAFDLDTELIMVKLTSGKSVEKHWGSWKGMSGSPLYIHGRLIGALAYGWPFALKPIAGVTPIREMMESYLTEFAGGSRISSRAGSPCHPAQFASRAGSPCHLAMKPLGGSFMVGARRYHAVQVAKNPADARQCRKSADTGTLVLQPVATPLMVTGLNEMQLNALAKTLEPLNYQVIPGIVGGLVDKKLAGPVVLKPGSSVACAEVDGDVQLIATGTVTYRKGNVILAYGHPFEGFGDIRFPTYSAYVYDVFASENAAWKICSPIERVGAITRDGLNAIGGVIGAKPRMVPVDISEHNIITGYRRKFHIAVVELRPFSAMWILGCALLRRTIDLGLSDLTHVEQDWGIYDINAAFQTDKFGIVRQHSVASAKVGGTLFPFSDQYAMLEALLYNPYEKAVIKHLCRQRGLYADGRRDGTHRIGDAGLPGRASGRYGEADGEDSPVRPADGNPPARSDGA